MWQYNETKQPDELMHYGILGMKWGQRSVKVNKNKANRAREKAKNSGNELRELNSLARTAKKGGNGSGKISTAIRNRQIKSAEKSRSGNLKKAKKYEEKAKKIKDEHVRLSGGKKVYDKVSKVSSGKAFAQSMMLGTYGALKYNEARATKNSSVGKAAVSGFANATLNNVTFGGLSIVAPRLDNSKKK